MTVHDAIERLVFEFLGMTHDGWENSDGAYGDFTFDIAERTITLDYNERYMQSEYSQHVFEEATMGHFVITTRFPR